MADGVSNKELYEAMEKLRKEIEADYKELDRKIEKTYTKLIQFAPVRNIVFGMVAIILSGFAGALVVAIGWQA